MPRKSLILQVFVASPSDVAEERSLLDSVIAELNRTWSVKLGLTFEVMKWETHVRPGFDEDPQAVVNSQLPDDYDVFLGIFWSRLGTPTGRAPSGTVEEFERAYARFKSTGSVPEIMLYFKDAPISPSKIDSEQLVALQTFKASISDLGGLFASFEDQAGFEASLRAHLSAVAQKFALSQSVAMEASSSESMEDVLPTSAEEDDFGLLDYLDIYSSRTQDMVAAITLINEATVRIGEQLSHRSTELPGVRHDATATRRSVKRAADDIFRYADTLAAQVTVLSAARQDAFSALSKAVALMSDFPAEVEQLIELQSTLYGTIEGTSTARHGMIGMRNAAASLPRISKDLNKAKRAVAENVDKFLLELDSTESTITNLTEAISKLLDSAQPANRGSGEP